MKESEYPTLNSILFGEGVVNDAVAILIYQAMEKIIEENEKTGDKFTITGKDIGVAFGNFLYLSVVSILIGVAFGVLTAAVLKFGKLLHKVLPRLCSTHYAGAPNYGNIFSTANFLPELRALRNV